MTKKFKWKCSLRILPPTKLFFKNEKNRQTFSNIKGNNWKNTALTNPSCWNKKRKYCTSTSSQSKNTKRSWSNICKVLRERNCDTETYLAKQSLKYKNKAGILKQWSMQELGGYGNYSKDYLTIPFSQSRDWSTKEWRSHSIGNEA